MIFEYSIKLNSPNNKANLRMKWKVAFENSVTRLPIKGAAGYLLYSPALTLTQLLFYSWSTLFWLAIYCQSKLTLLPRPTWYKSTIADFFPYVCRSFWKRYILPAGHWAKRHRLLAVMLLCENSWVLKNIHTQGRERFLLLLSMFQRTWCLEIR